jgi:hypothetical protein
MRLIVYLVPETEQRNMADVLNHRDIIINLEIVSGCCTEFSYDDLGQYGACADARPLCFCRDNF